MSFRLTSPIYQASNRWQSQVNRSPEFARFPLLIRLFQQSLSGRIVYRKRNHLILEVFNRFLIIMLEGKALRTLQVGENSLTQVQEFNLEDCSALETVQVGEKAFSKCTSLRLSKAAKLESIEIGSGAFSSGSDFVIDASDRLLIFSIGDSVMTRANELCLSGKTFLSGSHLPFQKLIIYDTLQLVVLRSQMHIALNCRVWRLFAELIRS